MTHTDEHYQFDPAGSTVPLRRTANGDRQLTLTGEELGALVDAVGRAPLVHTRQPWRLETHGRSAALFERPEGTGDRPDPAERDRLIACGAALANLELAVTALSRRPQVHLQPHRSTYHLVATIEAGAPVAAPPAEGLLYRAIGSRRSYRRRFRATQLDDADVADVVATAGAELNGVTVHRLDMPGSAGSLARLLHLAATALREHSFSQQEIAAWLGAASGEANGADDPIEDSAAPLPSYSALAARIATECVLVLSTPSDDWLNQVRGGMVMQRLWLAATVKGLVASTITQPLRLPEFRSGLAARMHLDGRPQVLLRLGYPARALSSVDVA